MLTNKLPSSSLAWLQQASALPFMLLMLPFATWYNPFDLSLTFQLLLLVYTALASFDLLLYYKALSIGDITIVAPLLNLTAVTSILSSYLVLNQTPTLYGIIGACLIITGSYIATKHRSKKHSKAINNTFAITLVLLLVVARGAYSPIEVTLLSETNPIYLNFVSSLLVVPSILLITYLYEKGRQEKSISKKVILEVNKNRLAIAIIGMTMAFNIFFTLSAKELAPNAGYVTAIKGAQVVPMTVLGVILFKEHVTKRQWIGILLISAGLGAFLFS